MPQKSRAARTIALDAVRSALKSQYHAALAMLRTAVRRCPDELWTARDGHAAPYWRIAYHALYYTDLYLRPTNRAFTPWAHHQGGIQRFEQPLATRRPYTKTQMLAYLALCQSMVDPAVDALDLTSPRSGFSWYRIPKLEHQIVNIRHIQYHQAQLADRLRAAAGIGVGWADARRRTAISSRRRRQAGVSRCDG